MMTLSGFLLPDYFVVDGEQGMMTIPKLFGKV